MTKICDGCRSSNAAMYCNADMAYMCVECDLKVHGANKLASRHERVWICEVCEHAPAAVLCKADAAALCSACDNDIHSANPLAGRHERVPVTPFFECPSMIKVAHINASSGVNPGSGGDNWPPLFPPSPTSSAPPVAVFDALLAPPAPAPASPASFTTFFSNGNGVASLAGGGCYQSSYSLRHSRSSPVVPDSSSSMSDISNTYSGVLDYLCLGQQAVAGMASNKDHPRLGREERVLRYREKKKNRKFEKTVRYASRKAYAEIRPRVKGRFVKRSSLASSSPEDAVEQYLLSSAITDGVVPSFC